MLEYEELRFRAREIGPRRYLAVINGLSSTADVIVVERDPGHYGQELDRLVGEELGLLPSDGDVARRLRSLGRDLFGVLLTDRLAACLRENLDRAKHLQPARGLRLRFDLPADLDGLPVEALAAPPLSPEQTLALDHNLSVVRSRRGVPPGGRLPEAGAQPERIRLLVAVASPTGLAALDPQQEISALERILPGYATKTTVMERATRKRLEDWLGDQRNPDVQLPLAVLLIAHGAYEPGRGQGVVYLEAEDGSSDAVPSDQISGMLVRAQQLRLVVLNLCAGARGAWMEPFSGMAQALVGRGIPAVVAMQSPVTHEGAGRFSPALLDQVWSNKTIDEAMNTARRAIADEWPTPVLFVHEAARHGWLFKAREVLAGDEPTPDPLAEGADALRRYEALQGGLDPGTILAAARFLRWHGRWDDVVRTAQTRQPDPVQGWLVDEARTELAWETLDAVCRDLAAGDPAAARARLAGWGADRLPAEVRDPLVAELDRVERLAGWLVQAATEEAADGWAAAVGIYDRVLAERPAGFGDTADRRAAAQDEVELAELYAAGEHQRGTGDWEGAATAYSRIIARRPDGYREATALLGYVTGREAEDTGSWRAAEQAFAGCPPELVLDSPMRQAHAEGRAAAADAADGDGDADERWSAARDAFRQAADHGWPDDGWLHYATGRAAEDEAEWEAAVEAYSQLPPHRFDVGDRRPYATGRAAEDREDWEGVIEGFRVAPDGYRDIGDRRRFARARIAYARAADGKGAPAASAWKQVLEALGDLPDDLRSGEVGALRHEAEGRLAEAEHDWARAAAALAAVAHLGDRLGRLHTYAVGRMHEAASDWAAALTVYETLPDDHGDVVVRRAYAQARRAEAAAGADDASGGAGWWAAVEAYAAVAALPLAPSDADDVAIRRGYASARLADADGDWEAARDTARALGDHLDAPRLEAYAEGRLAEAEDAWRRAVDAYDRCAPYRDAADRGAYAEGRLHEAQGRWGAAVEAYARMGSPEPAAAERRAHLERLHEALPWVDGLVGADSFADPSSSRRSASPYDALRRAGIGPAATTAAITDAAYQLLAEGGMSRDERAAWDELRAPASRLVVDALRYRFRDPDALRHGLVDLAGGGPGGALERLCGSLGEDGPLLLLFARGQEPAVKAWEQTLLRAPGDLATVHDLAIAQLWWAQDLEDSGAWEHAEWTWQRAIGCWSTLLTDDAYWARWRLDRAAGYGHAVTPADADRMRRELGQRVHDTLAACAEAHTGQGRPERAQTYRSLAHAFDVEMEAARALNDAGGLPVDGERQLACGPLYLHLVHLERALGRLVQRREEAIPSSADHLDEAEPRALRVAFSELASAFTFGQQDRYEQALQALEALPALLRASLGSLSPDCEARPHGVVPGHDPELACDDCAGFLHHNPAYAYLPHRRRRLLQDTAVVTVGTRLARARLDLTSGRGGIGRALQEWGAAVDAAERAAVTLWAKKQILRVVLGRVEALADDDYKQPSESLGESIELVERALPLLGGTGREPLQARLAELLTERGVWLGYGCRLSGLEPDFDQAELDLRRALDLNPESVRTRDNLARALIFGVLHRTAAKLAVVGEALHLLHEGLRRTPGQRQFRESFDETLDELEALLLDALSIADLGELAQRATGNPGADPAERARELAEQAAGKQREGDATGALHDLLRAARLDATDEQVRSALMDAFDRYRAEQAPGDGAGAGDEHEDDEDDDDVEAGG